MKLLPHTFICIQLVEIFKLIELPQIPEVLTNSNLSLLTLSLIPRAFIKTILIKDVSCCIL